MIDHCLADLALFCACSCSQRQAESTRNPIPYYREHPRSRLFCLLHPILLYTTIHLPHPRCDDFAQLSSDTKRCIHTPIRALVGHA